jgi:hypothetical protein
MMELKNYYSIIKLFCIKKKCVNCKEINVVKIYALVYCVVYAIWFSLKTRKGRLGRLSLFLIEGFWTSLRKLFGETYSRY